MKTTPIDCKYFNSMLKCLKQYQFDRIKGQKPDEKGKKQKAQGNKEPKQANRAENENTPAEGGK